MNKYEEIIARLDAAETLSDLVDTKSLIRKWYSSGDICHADFVVLRDLANLMIADWPNSTKKVNAT